MLSICLGYQLISVTLCSQTNPKSGNAMNSFNHPVIFAYSLLFPEFLI